MAKKPCQCANLSKLKLYNTNAISPHHCKTCGKYWYVEENPLLGKLVAILTAVTPIGLFIGFTFYRWIGLVTVGLIFYLACFFARWYELSTIPPSRIRGEEISSRKHKYNLWVLAFCVALLCWLILNNTKLLD